MSCFYDRFHWYCQKIIPLVYDESLSYYEVLCKLTDYIKELSHETISYEEAIKKLQTDVQSLQEAFPQFKQEIENEINGFETTINNSFSEFRNLIQSDIAEMENTLEGIKNGEYIDLYLDSIKQYIDENLQELVAGIVKYVTFGLTMDGYFCAFIPPTWDFLDFSTINDPDSELYGHLVLHW